jgi:hypothetical protein
MKRIFAALALTILIYGCCDRTPKEYTFKVYYFGCPKTPDTLRWVGTGTNMFHLKNGDLKLSASRDEGSAIVSGISKFEVISIREIRTNIPVKNENHHLEK